MCFDGTATVYRILPWILLGWTGAVTGCDGDDFVVIDGGFDAGNDAGPTPDAGTDAPPMDAGPDAPPLQRVDEVCETPWAFSETISETCGGRHTQELALAADTRSVSIVALANGQPVVAWHAPEFIDDSDIELRRLGRDDYAVVGQQRIEPIAAIGEAVGYDLDLVADGQTTNIAYWVTNDRGGVEFRQWMSDGTLTDAERIAETDGFGFVSMALTSTRETVIAFHSLNGGTIRSRRRDIDGSLSEMITDHWRTDRMYYATNSISLTAQSDTVHFFYRQEIGSFNSAPRYQRLISEWSAPLSIDNAGGGPLHAGLSIDGAVHGDRIVTAYFQWDSERAELRIAHVDADPIEYEVVTSFENVMTDQFDSALAMAFDDEGLLHLLVSTPNLVDGVQYWRQRRSDHAWIMDQVVHTDTMGTDTRVPVALAMVGRQPHLAYAVFGRVRHATITLD